MADGTTAYATVEDLEARWRALSESERARADVLIGDACVYLSSVVGRYGIDEEEKADALRIVCCDLVQRKMDSSGPWPVKSETQQAGPYSVTSTFATGTRKFRLYSEDLDLLGVAGGGIGCFWPGGAR